MKTDTILREVLSIESYSGKEWRMFAFIIRRLTANGIAYKVDRNNGNIYATKSSAGTEKERKESEGQTFPCIVAHMDTVHEINKMPLMLIEARGILTGFDPYTMTQSGIGGDDKVGVFIALRCLELFDNCKAAFFVNEESGCVGSGEADLDFFNDCRFVLQADRKGHEDFITNASGVELSGKEFQKDIAHILKKYGYKHASGMMTDVMQLKEDGLKVAAANVSCGYHRPHAADEYVVISQVNNTLALFCEIIEQCGKVYKHKAPARTYGNYGGYSRSDWHGGSSKGWGGNDWKRKDTQDSYLLYEERKEYYRLRGLDINTAHKNSTIEKINDQHTGRTLLEDGAVAYPTYREREEQWLKDIKACPIPSPTDGYFNGTLKEFCFYGSTKPVYPTVKSEIQARSYYSFLGLKKYYEDLRPSLLANERDIEAANIQADVVAKNVEKYKSRRDKKQAKKKNSGSIAPIKSLMRKVDTEDSDAGDNKTGVIYQHRTECENCWLDKPTRWDSSLHMYVCVSCNEYFNGRMSRTY